MGVEQSDTENLEQRLKIKEELVKNARGHISKQLLIEYFTVLSEKEQVPMLGLDRKNTIIFANEQAVKIFGSDPTGMGILELEEKGMLKEEDVKDYNDLARKSLRYNYVQFPLMGMKVRTQVMWYKNGNYKCAVARFKKPSLTKRLISGLASKLPSIFHKTKFGIGKYFPDAENPQYEVFESETSDGEIHIHLETLTERVTGEMAKASISTLTTYLDAVKQEEFIDVIIDLTESSDIDRKAIRNYAVFVYRRQRVFPKKTKFHFHANGRSEDHYHDYLKTPWHKPKQDRRNEKLDDFKITSLRNAMNIAVQELRYLNTEEANKIPEEEIMRALTKEYREIFETMLEESKLYWHTPPEERKTRGISLYDITAEKSKAFINRMSIGKREKWIEFTELISGFTKMNTKRRNAKVYHFFKPVFKRYLEEVYPNPVKSKK